MTSNEADWLDDIAASAQSLAPDAPGILVRYVRADNSELVGAQIARSRIANYLETVCEVESIMLRADPGRAAALVSRMSSFRSSELAAQLGITPYFEEVFSSRAREFGEADAFHIVGADPSGKALCVHMGLPNRDRRTTPSRTRRVWDRVAVHLAAAARLRRTTSQLTVEATADVADAVIDARTGKVSHLRPAAEQALAEMRQAAINVDSARSERGRVDPEWALEQWRGLFEGRWSVVDVFDSDGRRFIALCPNPPELISDSRLTRRERQVVAAIAGGNSETTTAYSLGVSCSTVRTHLSRALAKLRIERVVDLIALVGAMQPNHSYGAQ